jgi:hypothetical protein
MKCTSQRRDGKRCRANAINDQSYCFLHSSPGKASELGKTGGARRRVYDLSKLKRFSPARTPGDLLAIVTQSLCDLREGRIDHKTASSIGSLATVAQTLMRTSTLEERIAKLEAAAGGNHGR